MNTSTSAASRVVTSLEVLKWIVVAMWGLYALGAIQLIYSATNWPMTLSAAVVGVAFVGAWLSWTFLGWMQHVLGQLVLSNQGVAVNLGGGYVATSAKAGDPVQVHTTGSPVASGHFYGNGRTGVGPADRSETE